LIVGFQGRKRVGKNEAANRLAQLASPQGWDVEFRSFAGPLKATLCDLAYVEVYEREDQLSCMTARQLHQRFGEAARKHFGYALWLDLCLPLDFQHDDRLVLVTDVRPDYEVERIQSLGGVVVRLEGGDPFDGHSTEVLGGDPDYIIDATSRSLADLDVQLIRLWWWLCCGCPEQA
jgi:hypothetical protein